MFKKSLSSLALAGLLLTGFSVSQASADTPYVSDSSSADNGAYFTTNSTNSTSVVIPENVSYFHTEAGFNFTDEFLLAHAGQDLSYTVSVLDPSSNPITLNNGFVSSLGYSKGVYGGLGKNGGWVSIDWQTAKLSIPADPTGYEGSYNPYVDVSAANSIAGGKLEEGTYTVTFTLLAGGSAVSQETGLTVDNLDNRFFVGGNTFIVPEGSRSASLSASLCVDSTKVAVGDELNAELYLDDTLSGFSSNYWETRSSYKPQSDSGFRDNQATTTATVTQYDITNGLAVRVSAYYQDQLAVGSEHEIKFKLYNSTTNADVSGDCAPSKPATPTVNYSMMSLRVSGTYSFGSQKYNVGCFAYDKTAPTVIAQSTFANSMMDSEQFTCSFSGLSTGHTYFVRTQTSYDGKASALSDPSDEVLIPAGGYTFTTNYAGTVAAGKVVKVSDNVLPIEDLSNYTMTYPDGKGGLYTLGAPSTCNPMCGVSQARIRHFNGNYTLDSTFGGTGSIVLNSFSPSNPYVSGMGYYSTGKDKWVMAVSGYDSNQIDQKTQLIFGNAANATTTSKTLTKTDLNTACNTGAAGYGVRPSYTTTVVIYSAPVANPFLGISCYKEYTLADNSSQWLTLTVLATVDPATGSLSVKGALGTPSADANGFSVRTSTNADATGNEPMITAFVTSTKYTAFTNNTLVGTIADHSIIRISSNGTFLSTTGSAWGTSGGSSTTDSYISVASVNSGKIYGTLRAGMNNSLVTVGATGVATTTPIDASASNIMGGIINMLGGYPVASNETLIPVSVNGVSELSAGWVNSTTGVLTVGEKLSYTSTPGNGNALIWLNGNDKNTYLLVSAANAPSNLTVLKWIDSRYTAGSAKVQTITLSGPTNPEVDLDGIDLTASTNSGLAITFATTTPGVCSVDSTGHVTPITVGSCIVTATQAGNASWLSDSKQVTVVFKAPTTTPIVDNGNPAKPSILAKTGAWVKNGDTQLSWNRTKGTLAFKVSIVYIGPIKGTAVFKVGSKSYTCVVNFGTLKKQATAKRLVLTSPNLCSGAKEKAQLAALKKVPANTVVKLTIVRDMKLPTTYAKYRTKTRVIYAKLG